MISINVMKDDKMCYLTQLRRGLGLSALLLLSGCSYQASKPTPELALPSTYDSTTSNITKEEASHPLVAVQAPEQAWWQQFQTDELSTLQQELNQQNFDLRIARQQIERAQALLGQQQASHWPSLDGGLEHRENNLGRGSANDVTSLTFSAAYEVDLWGQRQARDSAAELALTLEQQRLQSVSLQLQTQISQQYFACLALQQRLQITEQNQQASTELLTLMELLFKVGRASAIEVDQQRNILLAQQQQSIALKRDLTLNKRALATLLGREGLDEIPLQTRLEQVALPAVSVVQPAQLLQSRPDIQMAESQLKIADANHYSSQTKRWPSLQLSASASLADLLASGASWSNSLIGGLTAPIFNGARIKQEIEAAATERDIAANQYRQTVLTAMQETLDTLTVLHHQRQLYQLQQQEFDNNRHLYDLAQRRYQAGTINFLTLLDAQRSWFNASDSMVQAKQDYLNAIVNTFKAMGAPPASEQHIATNTDA